PTLQWAPASHGPPMSLFPPPLNANVLSAPPSIVQRQKGQHQRCRCRGATATISAKPQITNPKAEVTRFVPTALRVRRDRMAPGAASKHHAPAARVHQTQTKDQVYEAFMREMEGLL
uniref:Uncharacterized protein n=1 Tax=Neogobius melanostomus TaxID=47308 RepID=A0A8C6S3R3_9GOBI